MHDVVRVSLVDIPVVERFLEALGLWLADPQTTFRTGVASSRQKGEVKGFIVIPE